jgi:TRAP-type C4-dicarboxylate transport system substrate-binding protein
MLRRDIRVSHVVLSLLVLALSFAIGAASSIAQDKNLPTVNWRCQSAFPPPTNIGDTKYWGGYGQLVEVVRRVKEKTNGKFLIKVYQPNTLFKIKGILDGVRSGAIEMAYHNGAYLKGKIPSAAIECIPVGGPRDAEAMIPLYKNTNWFEIVRHDYARFGIHYIGTSPCASAVLLSNVPISEFSDLKGHKIGASGAKADLIRRAGGIPVTIHSTDVYTALQRGTIDAVAYNAYTLDTYKFHEVVDYLIWANIQNPMSSCYIANLQAYKSLPPEYQKALNEAALEVAIYQLKVADKIDAIGSRVAEEHGIKEIRFDEQSLEKMKDIIIKVWDKYGAQNEDCAKLVALLKKYSYGIK